MTKQLQGLNKNKFVGALKLLLGLNIYNLHKIYTL